jgi:predicted metal-dependent HD superfamily phosphohydrolase
MKNKWTTEEDNFLKENYEKYGAKWVSNELNRSINTVRAKASLNNLKYINIDVKYEENEDFAVQLAKNNLPKYGYSPEQILQVEEIISSTKHGTKPKNLLEQIMCDADHDYLGRPDYFIISTKLRIEMENYGKSMSDEEWLKFQLHYLENVHRFHTETSQNIRLQGKKLRIEELKHQLDVLSKNQA